MKKFLKFWYLFFGLGLMAFSGVASAISAICISASQVGVPGCAGNAACIAQVQANHPECFGTTSSLAATSQAINSTVVQQMLAISGAVGLRTAASRNRPDRKNVDSGQQVGLAAGNAAAQWNFWGSINADNNKYDRGNYVDALAATRSNKYNVDVTNIVLGGDYQLSPTLAAGLSVAFDDGRGTGESFLTGVSQGIATLKNRGYTVAPYVGWQINQDWSLDATLGFGNSKTDTDGITGRTDRFFFGGNVNYVTYTGNWQLTGKGSYLRGEERSGNLTASNGTLMTGTSVKNKIDQVRLGAQAGYSLSDSFMPYFGLAYSGDVNRSTSLIAASQLGKELGRGAFIGTVGLNFFSITNSLTGGISYNHETGRTYARNHNLMANINFRF